MQTLYQLALITHIVGITLLAGTTLVEYLLTQHFWKLYVTDIGLIIIKVKDRLDLFYLSQLCMFLIIFTLSVFKFN
jgi:hypothetical protein